MGDVMLLRLGWVDKVYLAPTSNDI